MHDIHTIDPVSRIEGHAKITLHLGEDGVVEDARFHVTEFRGFEEFCRGRPVWEMPGLTARTCGICPVSHLLASAKAGDAIMAVQIPEAAVLQRRLANLGQIVQSHALSFFHLSAPDLLLGMDADPETRNVFALMREHPELVRRGIRLRQFGQEVIEAVAGERIHGPRIIAGGVAEPLTAATAADLRGWIDEVTTTAADALELFGSILERHPREAASFGTFPSMFLAHVGADGHWEHYDGHLRVIDADGGTVAAAVDPADYDQVLGEWGTEDSYLKSPYWRDRVHGDDPLPGMYRVGPMARLNVASSMGTPAADEALEDYRARWGEVATSSFSYHHARLIEVLTCIEQIDTLLDDPLLLGEQVRARAGVNRRHGVGASEAPRGTLFHDYRVDADGIVTGVNMLIATGQNNLAMNQTIRQIAAEWITGPDIPEGVLNRLEAGIRAFDPCLSCSTHALGQMPFHVQLVDPTGTVVGEVRRD